MVPTAPKVPLHAKVKAIARVLGDVFEIDVRTRPSKTKALWNPQRAGGTGIVPYQPNWGQAMDLHRRVTNFGAICLALAFALSTSSFAQTDRAKPPGSVGGTPQGGTAVAPPLTAKPSGLGRPVKAPGGMVATPLSESECGNLGGSVKADVTACLSGKACQTTSEDKQVHAVCISKQ